MNSATQQSTQVSRLSGVDKLEPTMAGETPAIIRVSYGEVDQMGVAYYGNYLRWFELGRGEYLRARGCTYRELEGERGLILPITEAYVRYKSPVRYDDLIHVNTGISQVGPVRFRFQYRICRAGEKEVLVSGFTVHACIDRAFKPMRLPSLLTGIITKAL